MSKKALTRATIAAGQQAELEQRDGQEPVAAEHHGIRIKPHNKMVMEVFICGTSVMVQHAFGKKAIEQIIATQMAGDAAKKKMAKNRAPKDFDACYEDAKHIAGGNGGGWIGIPAGGFRAGMVRACKGAGIMMTEAKLAMVVKADGYDKFDSTPLVKITKGEPTRDTRYARNDNGQPDIRVRPLWQPGWEAKLEIEYDGDFFTAEDLVNLLERMGQQVGIGEGRNSSPKSCGMGWGSFEVSRDHEVITYPRSRRPMVVTTQEAR
jgi:hypothetical protein